MTSSSQSATRAPRVSVCARCGTPLHVWTRDGQWRVTCPAVDCTLGTILPMEGAPVEFVTGWAIVGEVTGGAS